MARFNCLSLLEVTELLLFKEEAILVHSDSA
jgi:hypothetical protein